MPRRPDTPCRSCGRLIWRGTGSLPEPMCQPCRRLDPQRRPRELRKRSGRPAECAWCYVLFVPTLRSAGLYTRTCSQQCNQRMRVSLAGTARDVAERRSVRWQRDKAAPGLTGVARRRLLQRWVAQGRSCVYCPAMPTAVDHVVPLSRGGTNYEGNLVPACRGCNTSKSNKLLVEWRRREPRMRRMWDEVRGEEADLEVLLSSVPAA